MQPPETRKPAAGQAAGSSGASKGWDRIDHQDHTTSANIVQESGGNSNERQQMPNSHVTYSSKCYVTVCVGCDDMFQTSRRDQMTCTGACRVRAHRNGSMTRRKAVCAITKAEPVTLGWAMALSRLCPHLEPAMLAGELEFEDIMPDLNRAFVARVYEALRMTETAP
ncbi:hypothetical protein [Mesorhizobium sp. L2C085B000]|uniref:hypothetical protein n=1 Tax=Mesorhizobium sp. L2C085B000 TaxID=1287117 RepID=UPI0012DBFE9A|nr:hypothetical protein [Mesorhizobium sp. L2C085B000]